MFTKHLEESSADWRKCDISCSISSIDEFSIQEVAGWLINTLQLDSKWNFDSKFLNKIFIKLESIETFKETSRRIYIFSQNEKKQNPKRNLKKYWRFIFFPDTCQNGSDIAGWRTWIFVCFFDKKYLLGGCKSNSNAQRTLLKWSNCT